LKKNKNNHSSTNSDLLKERSHNKDLEMEVKDLEIRFSTATKTNEHLQVTCKKIQEKANTYMNKYENADRELKTKKQLILQIEKQKDELEKINKESIDKLEKEFALAVVQHEMHYEDLLSRITDFKIKYAQMNNENKKIMAKFEEQKVEMVGIISK